VIIGCLIVRLSIILQFNESIGPLIKIVGKMSMDFLNFFLIYVILVAMFSIVGNINFVEELTSYRTFFDSILTVIDASLGTYSFLMFEKINDSALIYVGQVFTISIVVSFNILLLNLIIAILANTYTIFDERSNGLYLSKILVSRDEMNYDPSYGSFLSAMPPLNLIQVIFVPIALVLRYNNPVLVAINTFVMKTLYSMLNLIFFTIFFVISALCLPFAYIIGIMDKLRTMGV